MGELCEFVEGYCTGVPIIRMLLSVFFSEVQGLVLEGDGGLRKSGHLEYDIGAMTLWGRCSVGRSRPLELRNL